MKTWRCGWGGSWLVLGLGFGGCYMTTTGTTTSGAAGDDDEDDAAEAAESSSSEGDAAASSGGGEDDVETTAAVTEGAGTWGSTTSDATASTTAAVVGTSTSVDVSSTSETEPTTTLGTTMFGTTDDTGDDEAMGTGGEIVANPSPGCSGGAGGQAPVPDTIVTLPEGYDPAVPSPVVFGFHGAGRTHEDFQRVDARMVGTDLERNYVMAYVKSAGSGWAWDLSDRGRVDAAFEALANNYCIDLDRVFATGHSSGAQFITGLLCEGERRFRAVAPVASSDHCSHTWDPVATLNIHGSNDEERGPATGINDADGRVDLQDYLDSNQCTDATAEYEADLTGCTDVDDGCVEYTDCDVSMVWCNHDDPSGRNHYWPCFANRVMFRFFESQR